MNDAVFTFRKDDPLATNIDSCSAVWIVDEIAQIEGQARPGELSPVPPYLREIPLAPVAIARIRRSALNNIRTTSAVMIKIKYDKKSTEPILKARVSD
jgi:hypothetical protein